MAANDPAGSGGVINAFHDRHHDHDACVDQALEAAHQACLRRGMRLTPLRRRVLELVWRGHAPVKAYALLDRLREERAGAAPPTVYRALEFLLEMGLIHRIESLNAYVGCPAPERPHAGQFLICTRCQAVAELDDEQIAEVLAAKARAVGFKVGTPTVEISGLCPRCSG